MATTDLAVVDTSGYLALREDLADVQEIIAENLAGQDFGEFDLTRISVPSGKATKYRWEIPTLDGSESVEEITGIIVHQKQSRSFWPLSIDDGGGNTPPACSSSDGRYGTGKQWATKTDPDPDGEPRTLACAECPNSKFGSDGGRGQACKQSTSLFVLMETGFLPSIVSVPPTSLAAMKKYMGALANAGIRYRDVVTVFALEKRSNAGGTDYAQIAPRLGARLDPDAAARAREYGKALAPVFERAAAAAPGGETTAEA